MKRLVVALVLTVACSDEVTPPPLPPAAARISVDSLSFAGAVGRPDPPSQSFLIRSDSSWRLTTSADWIAVSPESGRGDVAVEVTVRPLLLVGDITDTIQIAAGPGVARLPVHLHRIGRPARGILYTVPYHDSTYGEEGERVFVAAADATSPQPLWFRNPGSLGPDHFLPKAPPFSGPVFAPGGDSLAFLAHFEFGWEPYVVIAAPSGEVVDYGQIAPGSSCFSLVGGVTWSPDGRTLA